VFGSQNLRPTICVIILIGPIIMNLAVNWIQSEALSQIHEKIMSKLKKKIKILSLITGHSTSYYGYGFFGSCKQIN
jgi:hypothetical protein